MHGSLTHTHTDDEMHVGKPLANLGNDVHNQVYSLAVHQARHHYDIDYHTDTQTHGHTRNRADTSSHGQRSARVLVRATAKVAAIADPASVWCAQTYSC